MVKKKLYLLIYGDFENNSHFMVKCEKFSQFVVFLDEVAGEMRDKEHYATGSSVMYFQHAAQFSLS